VWIWEIQWCSLGIFGCGFGDQLPLMWEVLGTCVCGYGELGYGHDRSAWRSLIKRRLVRVINSRNRV
jgi:hypothetical protein